MHIERLLDSLKNRKARLMDQDRYHRYGILLPIVEVDAELHLLFEVRSLQLRSQPGDICFPGGRMDECDAGPMECALRETSEEIGIQMKEINQIIPLDYMIVGGRIIYPFAGKLKDISSMQINQSEVSEVFTVPLRFFMETEPRIYHVDLNVEPEEDFPFELIQNGRSYDWRNRGMKELFYIYENRVIWGLTAKIIRHFVQLIK